MARIRKADHKALPRINAVTPYTCTLYLIKEQGTDNYKIGIASHPGRRLSTLQTGNPRKLEIVGLWVGERSDCRWAELRVLMEFGGNVGTEWFASPDLNAGEISDHISRLMEAL